MKITGAKTTAAFAFILIAICMITVDAQPRARAASSSRTSSLSTGRTGSEAKPAQIDPILPRVRNVSDQSGSERSSLLPGENALRSSIRSIRTVDFYLKNGRLVFGKLISEDRNKVTLEQVEGSTLIVATYSKRDMESRTLQVKNVSASKYYQDMGEYFAGRHWDCTDDPDDLIQAIRFYSRAKQLIEGTSRLDNEKSKGYDKKIAELEADREVWTKQIESRAKLTDLEFKAGFKKQFDELKAMLLDRTEKIDKSVAQIDTILADVKKNTEAIDKNIPIMEQDLRNRLELLGREVDNNRRLLDPYGRTIQRNYGTRSRY